MIRLAIVSAAFVGLAGCASTAVWQHPSRAGEGHDGATMALAECQSYAAGTGPAPAPTARMDVPAPTSYTTRGTYTQYGNYGTFRGTTTANGGFNSNFASGYNSGAALGDAIASIGFQKRLKDVTDACMRTQGWIETSTPEGQAKFKQDAAASLAKTAAAKQAAVETRSAAEKAGKEQWDSVVQAFLQIEAARPGGTDYLNDSAKLESLDKYVKQLANDPATNKQSMAWFLVEAHKLVLKDEKAAQAGTKN